MFTIIFYLFAVVAGLVMVAAIAGLACDSMEDARGAARVLPHPEPLPMGEGMRRSPADLVAARE